MTHTTTNEIWVFGDLRTRHLLDLSLKVLAKAAGLAGKTGDRVVMFMLTPDRSQPVDRFG
jgi:electron transfer flavoprotein alpha subunit